MAVAACACSSSTVAPTLPSSAIIAFDNVGASRTPITVYSESGFLVSTSRGNWIAWSDYGNPRPFVEFFSSAGGDATGDIVVFSEQHRPFRFQSVDLYSSTTPIPYSITGSRNNVAVLTVVDRLPNTFGNFRTVVNPQADALIDTLVISLTNQAAPCCQNPMGLDNIVLAR
jgi:hypothetical protein